MIALTITKARQGTAALGCRRGATPRSSCAAESVERCRSLRQLSHSAVACTTRLSFQQKLPIAHDLRVVHPDIEIPADDVDVGGRIPLRAGVRAVRIAEGDVDAGIFFVLQNLADHVVELDVGADGELADAVAVLVGVGVAPEILFQFAVGGMRFSQAIALHLDGQRILPQAAKLRAEPIADDAIDHECSVDLARSGEHLAAGQVAPLVGADDAAGLEPAIVRDSDRQ